MGRTLVDPGGRAPDDRRGFVPHQTCRTSRQVGRELHPARRDRRTGRGLALLNVEPLDLRAQHATAFLATAPQYFARAVIICARGHPHVRLALAVEVRLIIIMLVDELPARAVE